MKQEKLSYPKMIMFPVQKMTREKAGRKKVMKKEEKKKVLNPNLL